MSVPLGQREENRMAVWKEAAKLAGHTMEITSGKTFSTIYAPLAARLNQTCYDAASLLWHANKVYVGNGCDPRNIADRLKMQSDAIALLRSLMFQIDLACKVTHRTAKSAAFWADMCRHVLNLAVRWRDSDAKRLKSRG